MDRRTLLPLLAAAPLAGLLRPSAAAVPHLVVYKSPACGCCTKWVEYLEARGFTAEVVDTDDVTPIKQRHGLPARLASCHTALVEGYVVEGHVPAADIRRLLAERPAVAGISAPGMPQLSPGMFSEVPQGYDVISFAADGSLAVWSRY